MDVCLGFGVEMRRGVLGLCLGPDVSDIGGEGGMQEENDPQGALGTLGQMDVFGL